MGESNEDLLYRFMLLTLLLYEGFDVEDEYDMVKGAIKDRMAK